MKRVTAILVGAAVLLTSQPAAAYPCEPDPLTCFRVDLGGPPSTNRTAALMGVNITDGQGNGIAAGNLGVLGVAHGSGPYSTATYNTGVVGQGRWGGVSVGVEGLGVDTDGMRIKPNANVIGVYGRGQTNGTGFRAGGYFNVGASEPSYTGSAALIADNTTETVDIASFRHNGAAAIRIRYDGTIDFEPGLTTGSPANTSAPSAWLPVIVNGQTYYLALYR